MKQRLIKWRDADGETFSTAIAGDFCPREENSDAVAARAAELTAPIKPFFDDADFRILQWECAATVRGTPIDKSGPNHRCKPECAAFATALNIDAVLLANNHTGDYDTEGVKDTLDTFRNLNIRTVGAGMDLQEAAKPLHIEHNGLKIALFNVAENEFGTAGKNTAGVCGLDMFRLIGEIKAVRSEYDLVIAALHGGTEHFPYPSPGLRQRCRFLAENGVDAVFNCHSHCTIGYEIYKGVPIVYSPGNFYFPARPTSLPCWYLGYVPKFFFDRNGAYALAIQPYTQTLNGVVPLNDGDSTAFFDYLDELSAPIANDDELQEIFDSWCYKLRSGSYFDFLFNRQKPDFDDRTAVKDCLAQRNLLTCEAHYELLKNTLRLMERYRLNKADSKVQLIETAQSVPWLKLN